MRRSNVALRLQTSLLDEARRVAESEGVALNQLINVAVAEKLSNIALPSLGGVGHRVVHGGPSLTAHQRITPQVLQTLEESAHFAPLHLPVALELNPAVYIPGLTERNDA